MPRRRMLWAAGVAVLVVAALLAFPRLSGEPPTQAADLRGALRQPQRRPQARVFSDGLTEDVIKRSGASGSVSSVKTRCRRARHRTVTPDQISRELGVATSMGSVRQADGRLRVGVELSDAMKGTLLWSERYDGEGHEVFEIQDRIVRNIAGSLAVKLSALEQQRAAAKPPENLEAYELVQRARELMRAVQRPANREARTLIAQAIKLSPNYAEAHAALAFAELQRAFFGWMEDPSDGLRRAEQAARRALAIDDPGANARAHAILGNIHTFTGNYEAALPRPTAPSAQPERRHRPLVRGGILLWTGKIEESIAASEAARRYDPRLPAEGMFNLALAYYLAGRYREAVRPRSRSSRTPARISTGCARGRASALGERRRAGARPRCAAPRPFLRREALRPAPGEPRRTGRRRRKACARQALQLTCASASSVAPGEHRRVALELLARLRAGEYVELAVDDLPYRRVGLRLRAERHAGRAQPAVLRRVAVGAGREALAVLLAREEVARVVEVVIEAGRSLPGRPSVKYATGS